MEANGCYCCPKPDYQRDDHCPRGMELDSALNELGMLSTVTDSRKQYLQENHRKTRKSLLPPRGRNLSESCLSGAGTPSNSPTKGIYQIVQLNPDFVTSLSAGMSTTCKVSQHGFSCSLPNQLKPDPVGSAVRECLSFGDKYKQEELEQDARANRLSRLKVSRVKRFRRPYELPWRRTLEQKYMSSAVETSTSQAPSMTSLIYSVNQHHEHSSPSSSSISSSSSLTTAQPLTPFICITGETQQSPRPTIDRVCNSNASTPEKSSKSSQHLIGQPLACSVTRSKSLDDLDISKLQLADNKGANFFQERQEIDSVSDNLRNLHVSGLTASNV